MEAKYMRAAGWLWVMQVFGLTLGEFGIPVIPGSVKEGDVTFFDIWNMALNLDDFSLERSSMQPGTILTPNDMAMLAMVPIDGPHPLYDDDFSSSDLRREFVLDHMCLEVVKEDDPRMTDFDGLTVMNMNGKPLTFHKLDDGSVMVNDLMVQSTHTLDDGTVIYEVDGLLFNHQDQVDEAFVAKTLNEPAEDRDNMVNDDNGPQCFLGESH